MLIFTMQWYINFYNSKVENLLLKWPSSLKAKFWRIVELIKTDGPNLGMPLTRALQNGLFEIRVKGREGIGRAFFCYIKENEITILHLFIKKTQLTPKKELIKAKKRLQEVLKNELCTKKIYI